ncbi:hypothetical protein B0T16DRAFT_219811 [Cercophora newfieldiana]|uniref:C2H2-type domain-containing protein n=1 Tax=Cercophora newfieldiana TaxID=92897 RepID=A0AA39XWU2_9PEZI|nr:hypothetical protein B0T16DRAFT_219811 [Cercophora newfieldiana]
MEGTSTPLLETTIHTAPAPVPDPRHASDTNIVIAPDAGNEVDWVNGGSAGRSGSISSQALSPGTAQFLQTSAEDWPDPGPARIGSDIPPVPASVPDSSTAATNTQQLPSSPAATQEQRATDRRNALRLALKRRWESGTMDHVHQKRQGTLRQRKEEQYAAASARLNEQASLPAGEFSAGHARKTSSNPEQLARLLSEDNLDWLASDDPSINSSLSPLAQEPDTPKTPGSTQPPLPLLARPTEYLEMTPSERPYKSWKDHLGAFKKSGGALFPDNYELSNAIPDRPWICPIRSCRKVYAALLHLGSHFFGEHRAAVLHDNLDGTLSLKGFYLVEEKGASNPMVVSRGPPPASEPPPVEPSLPLAAAKLLALKDTGRGRMYERALNAPYIDIESNEDWKLLWEYLQQFLIRHKGPTLPKDGWVSELITLPKVRDLQWNATRQAQHPFLDSKARDVSAMIIQLTGEPAPSTCTRCLEGKGPFDGCIMISKDAHIGPLKSVFACANCFYHYNQTYCSHKNWGAKRANAISQERVQADPNLGERFKEAWNTAIQHAEDRTMQREASISGQGSQQYDGRTITDYTPIETTEDGRPYDMWPNEETGELTTTAGAILPGGYQLDTAGGEKRWICPIRTCRRTCARIGDLGIHFQRAHFACLLNDNGDGTLSEVGVYPGGSASAASNAIVISRRGVPAAPRPHQTPPDTRNQPRPDIISRPPIIDTVQNPSQRPDTVAEPPQELQPPGASQRDPMATWDYMTQYIARQTIPESNRVHELLTMPRRRDLNLNPTRAHRGFVEKSTRDIAAMALQLTGETAVEACKRCRNGKGLFEKCIVLDRKASYRLKSRYRSCANCLYHGNQPKCTIQGAQNVPNDYVADDRPESPPYTDIVSDTMHSARLRSAQEQRQLERVAAPEPAAPTPAPAAVWSLDHRDLAVQLQQPLPPPDPTPPQIQPPQQPQLVQPVPSAPPISDSSMVYGGVLHTEDVVEMETWELAPGRIPETSAAEPENIAYSKPYLLNRQVTPVFEEVSFHVKLIQSGETLRIEPEEGKKRMCSVATGKVRVQVGDEPEFTIGLHGLFKLKPGVGCRVKNRMYVHAVLHITVIDTFI